MAIGLKSRLSRLLLPFALLTGLAACTYTPSDEYAYGYPGYSYYDGDPFFYDPYPFAGFGVGYFGFFGPRFGPRYGRSFGGFYGPRYGFGRFGYGYGHYGYSHFGYGGGFHGGYRGGFHGGYAGGFHGGGGGFHGGSAGGFHGGGGFHR